VNERLHGYEALYNHRINEAKKVFSVKAMLWSSNCDYQITGQIHSVWKRVKCRWHI